MNIKKQDRKLKELYAEIPSVIGCKEGCGECCGPVPIKPAEALSLGLSEKDELTSSGGLVGVSFDCRLMCPESKTCTKYEDRPLMCRLFAASKVQAMQCPHGARAVNPLSIKRTEIIRTKYKNL